MQLQQYKFLDILITGASGVLGQALCKLLDLQGIAYLKGTSKKIGAPDSIHLDLRTGEGISEAVQNRKIILHLATDIKKPASDVTGTQQMLEVLTQRGETPHFIYISIVGIDQVPLPYYKKKLETETVIQEHNIPYTILRATQFHSFLDEILTKMLSLPVGFLPLKARVQPVDVAVVARKLLDLMEQKPSYQIHNLGGRETYTLKEAANLKLKVQGKKKVILNLPVWGRAGKSLRKGALTCDIPNEKGETWPEWLAKKYLGDAG